ncbi:MAG: MlaD family protein [Aeromicrobium sp.]|uniref:MlaD family protein n=1 Tax=Aeromicrobium sp. TaxID=1871063 RepID=UPI0039E30554
MKRLPLKLVVAALGLALVFVLTAVYIYQEFLGGSIAQRPAEITVKMDETGGLFERSSVTYRGVNVGQVKEIVSTEDGVEATLALDPGVEVPKSSKAVVRNLSPAGEQFIDLQPESAKGPFFKDGDAVTEAAETPTTVAESFHAVDTLMSQVEPADLKVTLDELSAAFSNPDDLATIVTSGQQILTTLDTYWPETERIINNSNTVLQTGAAIEPQLRSLAPASKRLTAWLAAYDPKARTLLAQTPAQIEELRSFTAVVGLRLPSVLTEMGEFTDMTLPYRPHLWSFLSEVPSGFAKFASTVRDDDGDGQASLYTVMYTDLSLAPEVETVCQYVPYGPTNPDPAYVRADGERLIDTTRGCSPDFIRQQRGSAHAPGPVAR